MLNVEKGAQLLFWQLILFLKHIHNYIKSASLLISYNIAIIFY
jgi:hypothetical protein